MPHLLPGDGKNVFLPAPHHLPPPPGHLLAAQRIGGVEILHHQTVLDLGGDVQQHTEVVFPGHAGDLGYAVLGGYKATGDKATIDAVL